MFKAKLPKYQQLLLYSFDSYFKHIIEVVVSSDYLKVIITKIRLDYPQPHFVQFNSKEVKVKQIVVILQFTKEREYAKEY